MCYPPSIDLWQFTQVLPIREFITPTIIHMLGLLVWPKATLRYPVRTNRLGANLSHCININHDPECALRAPMKSKDSLIILEISRVTSRDKQETSLWGNLILHYIITKMYLASVKNTQVTDSRQEVQLHTQFRILINPAEKN